MTDERRKAHQDRMAAAAREMAAQQIDPTADSQIFRADLGRGTWAHSEIPTTSTKILLHDKPYEQLRNRHPDLESFEVESLLSYCYGKAVLEAVLENFSSFSRERFEEVINMSQEEVEDFLYDEEEEDE